MTEYDIELCKFCGKAECNCCPNCGSPVDINKAEIMCDVCGWAQ
jgi:hypothetical protein